MIPDPGQTPTTPVDGLGFVDESLGLITLKDDFFPRNYWLGCNVRVTVGLDGGGLTNAGGDLPDVRLFAEDGKFIGMEADWGPVQPGTYGDVNVDYRWIYQFPLAYTLFSANTDAICIAYTAVVCEMTPRMVWFGDWGWYCGGSWYHSNVLVGDQKGHKCFWIDANGDQPQTGFQVHWANFTQRINSIPVPEDPAAKKARADEICKTKYVFHMSENDDPHTIFVNNPIEQNPDPGDNIHPSHSKRGYGPPKSSKSAKFRSRKNKKSTSSRMSNHLVISGTEKHSSRTLCDSDTSWGPDFLNMETGTFCRMTDKTHWSVCDGAKTTDNCFNTDLKALVINGVSARDKAYERITDWTAKT
ncbi:hypothetical protein F4777DRAFT_554382 [Nemania sp. FL0916]|nr:hypothetical protein F4777DRAFT_554382 [Nemania sp. FL0916]